MLFARESTLSLKSIICCSSFDILSSTFSFHSITFLMSFASSYHFSSIAEAVIDEKWDELAKDIKKVIEWKEKVEDRISKLEQQIIDLRLSVDSLAKSIMGKISAYDQNITDVGTEIKAMEKVFQKVLPTLTENVNKLDRMTKGYREPQQQKK